MKTLKITLKKRKFGRKPGHRACVEGLGLRKIGQVVTVPATPENCGMANKVDYLLQVEEI